MKMKSASKNNTRLLFLLVCLLASFNMVCRGEEIAARKFMVTASANLFRSANAVYRQFYGKSVLMPEIKITRMVWKKFTVWGGFGWISKQGFIEEVDEMIKIKQTFLSLGVGYAHNLSASFRLRGELGLALISFKEEALQVIQKGSGLGWKVGVNLDYFLNSKLFALLAASYSQAGNDAQLGKLELGGFQAGAGLGFAF